MVGTSPITVFLFAAGTSLFMAWTIGTGLSGSTTFAPAVGAKAITIMRAAFVVGIQGFADAVLQGANVSEVSGRTSLSGSHYRRSHPSLDC
jgi:PiT family inorganic phosphate transporter